MRVSHRSRLGPSDLLGVAREAFETAEVDGVSVVARYGALQRLAVRAEGKELLVDVSMDPKVPDAVAQETIRRYNRFLEAATGYSSKERAKRLRKSAAE